MIVPDTFFDPRPENDLTAWESRWQREQCHSRWHGNDICPQCGGDQSSRELVSISSTL